MTYLIISCSLNEGSKSRILAKHMKEELGDSAELVDMRDHSLPFCDGSNADAAQALFDKIEKADGILVATPIYNYTTSSTLKNLLELTGKAWTGKVVGFLCAAGGKNSYMAVMSTANSLMLDFRTIIVPRFVYADWSAFSEDGIKDEKIVERLGTLKEEFVKIANALK